MSNKRNLPRSEYPRPQLVRKNWICLNGEWDFEIDNALNGTDKNFIDRSVLNSKITVPFCPESILSGIGNTDFMSCVWYRRSLTVPVDWKNSDSRVIFHVGAADYHSIVFVNGKYIGEHKGGYTPFSFDITDSLRFDESDYVTICVNDDVRGGNQPCGKQSQLPGSHGCYYTRTTGIWQTVWLEKVATKHIKNIKTKTDPESCSVIFNILMSNNTAGSTINASVFYEGKKVGEASAVVSSFSADIYIKLTEKHLWEAGNGRLYDVVFEVVSEGKMTDTVESYFGLRSVALKDGAFLLNGKSVFGRWVLDQGFYPDGIYTAPTDEALKNDIINSQLLGFNGARLHEKVFEPRFLYWADRLGYMVWGEHANWSLDISEFGQIEHFLPEWIEAIDRDFSHPSIIGWCPFNETWDYNQKRQNDMLLRTVYRITKQLDPTRPVIDTSGNYHVETDIFDIHDYNQNKEQFASHYNKKLFFNFEERQTYNGEPYFVSEYGGIKWTIDITEGWGYGDSPQSEEEFLDRYRSLTETLLANEKVFGFCYTQLYDVEQELNGLMTYDRRFKFPPEIIKEINIKKAAIE